MQGQNKAVEKTPHKLKSKYMFLPNTPANPEAAPQVSTFHPLFLYIGILLNQSVIKI